MWEKSLGAVLKSGTDPLNDVVDYGEPVTTAHSSAPVPSPA
ncbi:hypothetical protein [Streptomyces sp. NBC_00343]